MVIPLPAPPDRPPRRPPHTGEHVGGNIGESHIVRVIDTSHKCELVVVDKPVHHEITFIPILASIASKGITEPSLASFLA